MIFVDASAIVALLCREDTMERVAQVFDSGAPLCTSPIAMVEAALALVHRKGYPPAKAGDEVEQIVSRANMMVAPINRGIFRDTLSAFERFGKGRHKAKLNMGDCFAHAMAKSLNASILFVGDDFLQTDLPDALADLT